MRLYKHNKKGVALIITLAILLLLALLGITFATLTGIERGIAQNRVNEVRAKLIAESGINYADVKLREHLKSTDWFFPTTSESKQWIYWGDVTDEGATPNSNIPIEDAKNPSFAYEDEATQNPTDANTTPKLIRIDGKDVGFSGFMDTSTYGIASDIYTLKVTDLTGRIYINDGLGHSLNTANLKRLLNNLGKALGVSGLGNTIIFNRPSNGYVSVYDLQKNYSADDFNKFKDLITTYAWVDDKVVNPVPLSPAVAGEYLPELISSRPVANSGSRTNSTSTDSSGRVFRYGRGKRWNGKWVGSGGNPTSLEFYTSSSNLSKAMIYGWDELNPCYIERTSRAPININTASYEVLVALLDGIEGFFVMENPSSVGRNGYDWYNSWHDYDYNNYESPVLGIPGVYRGEIGIVYRTASIAGPTGSISGTSPASLAEKIADAIIKNRSKKPSEITKEYEGPFTSWAQFSRFIDGLVKTSSNPSGIIEDTTGRFNSIQTSFPSCPVKMMANQAMADAIKANFNPNLHLNELNPNEVIHTLVDKTDLIKWSTEFCFTPMGYVEVVSLGRVLKPLDITSKSTTSTISEYQEMSQKKVRVVYKLFDAYRDDLQKNFYEGKITADGVSGDSYDGLPDIYADTGYRTSNNLPLETGPEPDNGLAPMENEYEGYVVLSSIGGDLPASGGTPVPHSQHKPKGAVWETPRGDKDCNISSANVHAHYGYDFDLHYAKSAEDIGNDDKRRALTHLWNMGKGSINNEAIPPYNFSDWSEDNIERDGSDYQTVRVRRSDISTTSDIGTTGSWGAWTGGPSSPFIGGRAIFSDTAGATATFTFTGNGVGWYSHMADTDGTSSVLIDGVLDGEMDHHNSGSNSVLSYIKSGLPYGTHTLTVVAGGAGKYTDVDAFTVFKLNSSTKTTPRIGPYCYVDSPSVTPFSSNTQSRYRLCRSYKIPTDGTTSSATYDIYAPADLRMDGAYNERHNAELYWPGKSNSLMPGMDDGSNMNFWVLQGGASYWIKPSYYPETAGKIRSYFSSNRIHRRYFNPSPLGHWFLPGQQSEESGLVFYDESYGPYGFGYQIPISRTFGWGYSFIGHYYGWGGSSTYGFFYYPGCFINGGLTAGVLNHIGHSESNASSIGRNNLKAHKWVNVTLLWDMMKSSNLGVDSVDLLVNGQPLPDKQVFYRYAFGAWSGGYAVSEMPKHVWNMSDGGYQTIPYSGNEARFYINPLRIGEPSLGLTNNMNFSADSTIDEFYVWPRKGTSSTNGTAHYEGRQQFRFGRYYKGNNGIFTSRDIDLSSSYPPQRKLPAPTTISPPPGGSATTGVSGGSTPPSPKGRILGVSWTMMSEDYRFSGDTSNPLGYILYDYRPQLTTSGAEPTAMTQYFRMRVSGDGGSTWSVNKDGTPDLSNPGWNSVRETANLMENLPIDDVTKIKYRVKFETESIDTLNSILLATPVLDDVTIFYTNGRGPEVLEYGVIL